MAAAVAAARCGASVTLYDEGLAPGGRYLPAGWGSAADAPLETETERRARAWRAALQELPITLRLRSLVWALEGRRLAVFRNGASSDVRPQATVIATGAREFAMPFPGWTLPGVMTAGGAQLLAKAHGIAPGSRVVVAGSGPLLLPAATALHGAGARVAAVLEATRPSRWLRHFAALWGHSARLREGLAYLRALRAAGIPYRFGQTVVRAEGTRTADRAVIARLDRSGTPRPGGEYALPVDTVAVSFGLIPNCELTRLAGCEHTFDAGLGGWVPLVDRRQETTVPGLFAAGEAAGVGGAALAMVEGEIAGLAAAATAGFLDARALERRVADLDRKRRRERRFGRMVNELFAPGRGLDTLAHETTILCRCEGVVSGDVRAAIRSGADRLDPLKNATRVGQGPCQGRTCEPVLARTIARQTGRAPGETGRFRIRPPVKPLPLEGILWGREG